MIIEPPLRATEDVDVGDMPPDELRRHGEEVARWIAEYLDTVQDHPVLSPLRPGELRDALPGSPPSEGEAFEAILGDFRDEVLPGITHWNHPAFFAFFSATGSGPGILGEMLTAALNVNAMVWRSSPAATELEEVALGWLRQLLGLPEDFEGVINDTASSSSLYALAAAREANLPEASEDGLAAAPRARIYASTEAHSSIHKAAITLGLGRKGLRKVETDELFRMRPDALRAAVEDDLEQGVRPLAVVATIGTTSSTSVDPVDALAEVAREHGLWLHVDAAYAGGAAMVPELRPLFQGWEEADSVVMNPHKWIFTPVDCSALYCRRPAMLRRAFSITPEYLKTREDDEVRNLMDYGVSLGRRFRALKLWFVLRYFGAKGMENRIRYHVGLARKLASWVDAEPGWERLAPTPFSTVAFRFAPEGIDDADDLNREILDRVNASGETFLSHTRLRGDYCIRLAIGNLRTREEDVRKTWDLLRRTAVEVMEEGRGAEARLTSAG
ncbi:MAG: pyridoxal-dependent decarboxylase [Longimicrobiales bacterium]|nr:pyridoxal-dependent decarboxylase [Longimicrobiales bacterium]